MNYNLAYNKTIRNFKNSNSTFLLLNLHNFFSLDQIFEFYNFIIIQIFKKYI